MLVLRMVSLTLLVLTTCMSCNDPHAQDIHLVCFWCDKKFHAVCRDQVDDKMVDKKSDDNICTRLFFNSYKTNTDSLVYQKDPTTLKCFVTHVKLNLKIYSFSPQQLVFGYSSVPPGLDDVKVNLSQLDSETCSKMVADNINALYESRKAFLIVHKIQTG